VKKEEEKYFKERLAREFVDDWFFWCGGVGVCWLGVWLVGCFGVFFFFFFCVCASFGPGLIISLLAVSMYVP